MEDENQTGKNTETVIEIESYMASDARLANSADDTQDLENTIKIIQTKEDKE